MPNQIIDIPLLTPQEHYNLQTQQNGITYALQSHDGSLAAEQSLRDRIAALESSLHRIADEKRLALVALNNAAEQLTASIKQRANDVIGRRLDQAWARGDLLDELRRAGATVESVPVTLLRPGTRPAHGRHDLRGEARERFADLVQPRLVTLLKGLVDAGIGLQHLHFQPGIVIQGSNRREPYMLISLPAQDRQIAVCDSRQQMTFISHRILPAAVWSSTKDDMRAEPSVQAIAYSAFWLPRLRNFVHTGSTATLTKERLTQSLVHHVIRHGEWPGKQKIPVDDLPGEFGATFTMVFIWGGRSFRPVPAISRSLRISLPIAVGPIRKSTVSCLTGHPVP